MEEDVTIWTDLSVQCRVVLSEEERQTLKCFGYSTNGDGLPCFHVTAVLCEKHEDSNIHRFTEAFNLVIHWKSLYENVSFKISTESDVDEVISRAKRLVVSGENRSIPKALSPLRGRPVKHASVRRKGCFDRSPAAKKKRRYACSLFSQEGHFSTYFQLRQLFGDSQSYAYFIFSSPNAHNWSVEYFPIYVCFS